MSQEKEVLELKELKSAMIPERDKGSKKTTTRTNTD
jgi:hypothetical protein